jgi:thymidylate kinase
MEKTSIPEFIEYKKSVEAKRPKLTASSKIITIDGIDGSGKSSLARMVYEKMVKKFGSENVVLTAATKLEGGPNQLRLKALEPTITPELQDKLYLAGVNRAYGEVIVPAIESGKFVIIDKTEVGTLRYALESGNEQSIKDRFRNIKNGTVTHRYLSGKRVFVDVSPEDAWRNLENREGNTVNDPTSLDGVRKRVEAQKEAERQILDLEHEGDVEVLRVTNKRQASQEEAQDYLNQIANEIVSFAEPAQNNEPK